MAGRSAMRTIVISVGISLLTNNTGILDSSENVIAAFQDNQAAVDEIDVTYVNSDQIRVRPENIPGLYDFTKGFIEKYFSDDEIKNNITRRQNGNDHLPAEISSLYLYYYDKKGNLRNDYNADLAEGSENDFSEKDQVILLTTDTADAVYCANLIREMINGVFLFNTKCCAHREVVVIKNLDVYDPSKWASSHFRDDDQPLEAEKGLTKLYEYFRYNFPENQRTKDRILLRTGGYKELSADLKLVAIQFRFKSYYLFERSYSFVQTYTGGWPRGGDLSNIIRRTKGTS